MLLRDPVIAQHLEAQTVGQDVLEGPAADNAAILTCLLQIKVQLDRGPANAEALANKLFPCFQHGVLIQQDWAEGLEKLLDMLHRDAQPPQVLLTNLLL